MNNKGLFLPIFVIVVLVAFSALAYNIKQTKASRQDVIGLKAASIMKVYDEEQKINVYLDQSLKYSKDSAIKELYSNTGYPANNKCRKIPESSGDRFIILDKSCGNFNPESNFKGILTNNLKPYLQNYKSTYKQFREGDTNIQTISTSNVNSVEIKEITKDNQDLVLTFSDMELKIENSPESSYKFSSKLTIKNLDLTILDNIYKALAGNCVKEEPEICKSKLKNIFSDITFTEQGNFLKIIINNQIKLAIDLNEDLPSREVISTTT